MASILAYELYLVGLAFAVLALEEWFFAALAGRRYLEARAEAELLIRRLREGGGSRRSVSKALARLRVLQASLRRLMMVRLVLIFPFYTLAAAVVMLRAGIALLPVNCCVPGLTVSAGGTCVTTSPMLLAVSFLAALPLILEDLVLMLLLRPGHWRGRVGA